MLFGKKKQREVLTALDNRSSGNPYWQIVWRRFRQNKLALWAFRGSCILVLMALLSPFLANEKPLYAKIDGHHYLPVCKDLLVKAGLDQWPRELVLADWVNMDYEAVVRTPIPYHANYIDKANTGKGPFDQQDVRSWHFRHWMGTDELGRDVTAGMIRGASISLMVGIVTMFIASIIGLFFGAVAGYFGDGQLKLSRVRLWLNVIGLLIAFYYAFGVRSYLLIDGDRLLLEWGKRLLLFAVIWWLFDGLAQLLERYSSLGKKITIGVDLIIMRLIEAFNTIPPIFLLLAALPLFAQSSVFNIMLVLGLISWTNIAQFVRGELLRVRRLPYIDAAQVLGFSSRRIILRHALPNALTPVLITIAFGMAGAILAESALSFLGIGVGPEEVTWGKLLSKGRSHFSYWWLTVFPGLAIFLTVTIFNLIGDGLSEALR